MFLRTLAEPPWPGNELFDAVGRVVEALLLTGGPSMGIEVIFADIDAYEDATQGNSPEAK